MTYFWIFFSSLHLAIQDGKGSKEAERQNVLLCVLCADVPGGAQEEASRGVCQLRRVLQEMLWALEGKINSCHFFHPISQIKNKNVSLLNRLKSIVFFQRRCHQKRKASSKIWPNRTRCATRGKWRITFPQRATRRSDSRTPMPPRDHRECHHRPAPHCFIYLTLSTK